MNHITQFSFAMTIDSSGCYQSFICQMTLSQLFEEVNKSLKKTPLFHLLHKWALISPQKRILLLLLWRILNGHGLPNCLTELPSLKCLSSSLHSRDSHPFANVLRPSPSGSPSASPTLTCALQE